MPSLLEDLHFPICTGPMWGLVPFLAMDLWELMQQHGLYVLDKSTGFAHRAELSPVEQALVDLAVAHALVSGHLLWPAQEP